MCRTEDGRGTERALYHVKFTSSIPASFRALRTATRLLVWSKKEEGRGLPGKGGMEGGRDTSILQARHVVQTRSVTEVVEEHYT